MERFKKKYSDGKLTGHALFSTVLFCFFSLVCLFGLQIPPVFSQTTDDHTNTFSTLIKDFANASDRSSGSDDTNAVARLIHTRFKNLGFKSVGVQTFSARLR